MYDKGPLGKTEKCDVGTDEWENSGCLMSRGEITGKTNDLTIQ